VCAASLTNTGSSAPAAGASPAARTSLPATGGTHGWMAQAGVAALGAAIFLRNRTRGAAAATADDGTTVATD
jgi:LPXTG-motif cell wall-anchored protein